MVEAYHQGSASVCDGRFMASPCLCLLSPSIQFSFPRLGKFCSAIGSKQFLYSWMVITAYRGDSHIKGVSEQVYDDIRPLLRDTRRAVFFLLKNFKKIAFRYFLKNHSQLVKIAWSWPLKQDFVYISTNHGRSLHVFEGKCSKKVLCGLSFFSYFQQVVLVSNF